MFQTKKKKIKQYLQNLAAPGAFDEILNGYLDCTLKSWLTDAGMTRTDIHVDWLPEYRCVGIQGKYGKYYVDIQVHENTYTFSADLEEPDEDREMVLTSAEAFYSGIARMLSELHERSAK